MNQLSPKVAEMTRREWRELGFFYVSDDVAKEWQLTGSRSRLLGFATMLRAHAMDPQFAAKSEHQHFGPDMYLEVITWPSPGMDRHSIHGTQADIARLAEIVERVLGDAKPGDVKAIKSEFAHGSEYAMVLRVKPEGFDPASADPQLAG